MKVRFIDAYRAFGAPPTPSGLKCILVIISNDNSDTVTTQRLSAGVLAHLEVRSVS